MTLADSGLALSYKETEALVRELHGVGEARAPALFARFKYLQRMDFPERPVVGRGSRVGYRFEEMMQLVLVFQLMEVGIAPLRIVRMLRTNWPELRRALADAHAFLVAIEGGEREESVDLLVSTPNALAELGVDEDGRTPVRDPLIPERRDLFDVWADPDAEDWRRELPAGGLILPEDRGCVRLLVDAGRVVRLVRAVLVDRRGLDRGTVDAAFNALGRA